MALTDIEDHKREALRVGEKRLLEMIATGGALEDILIALSLMIEEQRSGTLASVLLLNPDGVHLDFVAGPSLPDEWRQQMAKLPIGPCAGSCGTAAFRGSPVIVSDIKTDPLLGGAGASRFSTEAWPASLLVESSTLFER
jgi:hypothetical protein